MAFELVRQILSQGSPLYWSWTHEPTMENGSLDDQQGDTLHGTRDVSEVVELEQYDWSELARAPITKQPNSLLSTDRNLYSYNRAIVYKSKEVMLSLYKTLVRPHLEYCTVAWSAHCVKDKPTRSC